MRMLAPERIDLLQERGRRFRAYAELLPEPERALVQALFEHGHSLSGLARITGLWPSTLHRRLERIVTRISSPKFAFVAARLGGLTPVRQRVGRACVLHGRSLRQAALELRLPGHVVRRHVEALHAMFEAAA